jgi:hypothetical protein
MIADEYCKSSRAINGIHQGMTSVLGRTAGASHAAAQGSSRNI